MADYCTVDEIRRSTPDVALDGMYDETLAHLAAAASRAVDLFTSRAPGAYAAGDTGSVRYYAGRPGGVLTVDEMVAAPTVVKVDQTGLGDWLTLAATDYGCLPVNALSASQPYHALYLLPGGNYSYWPTWRQGVQVTAIWGYSATPDALIVQVTAIQAFRWFRRGQQGFADTGANIELGRLMYTKELDPDLQIVLQHLRRKVL